MPELTYEEATREETAQEKKLRQTLKNVWGGGVADVLARFTTDTTPGEVSNVKQVMSPLPLVLNCLFMASVSHSCGAMNVF